MPAEFAVTAADDGSGVIRVQVHGELDLATVPELDSRLRDLDPTTILVLDLSTLSFIDSSGLRAVIELHDRSKREGWTLRLVHGPPEVRRVFKLTSTDSWLPFV